MAASRPKRAARPGRASAAPAAPRKRDYLDADERRRRLLVIGMEAFGRTPYDQVSLDDLAQGAGISKGLVFHYFGTKHGFYTAVVEAAAEQLVDRVVLDPSLPYEERLRRGVDAYLQAVEERGETYAAVVRGGVGSDPAIGAIVNRTRQRFIDRVVAEAPPLPEHVHVDLVFHGWVGYVEATSVRWLASREMSRADLGAHLAQVLLSILRDRLAPR